MHFGTPPMGLNLGNERPVPPDQVAAILTDPTASRWLCDALRSALVRDPVDVANEADVLARVLAARASAATVVTE